MSESDLGFEISFGVWVIVQRKTQKYYLHGYLGPLGTNNQTQSALFLIKWEFLL
jgi:hypothetical protein